MKRFFIYTLPMLFLACIESPDTSQYDSLSNGHIERYYNFKSQFIGSRTVEVWLPDDYSNEESYAVLYMHDGQMLFDSTTTWNKQEWGVDEVMSRLMDEGKIKKTIVVGIFNAGASRHAEYFPQKPFEMISHTMQDSLRHQAKRNESNLFVEDIYSDRYLSFLIKELKPFIDSSYSTKSDVSNTFVSGSSMGGLISMYAVCEYPEIFGGAACLSTHWPGGFTVENNPIPPSFMKYLKENLPNPINHKFYFDYGTETLDALYEPYQLQVDTIMREMGYNSNQWMTKKFEGADHSENSWNERLHIPLTFLLE